ncbi:TonB-dependent receptor [Luteolibacter flavescens]|uniref:TonB-dependent receptor n=1 Tax=Luteolibacter flavescens TaxID=1859460 RepID=A0ABT3FPT2_9BACT|nr:TonB-dependent receptor [Luteolibacter flavescens]MCW1885579.1 TonB-dependent receptor [Luteolibacter flavescens]
MSFRAAITLPLILSASGQDLLEPLTVTAEMEEMTVTADASGPPSLGQFSMQSVRTVPEEILQRNAAATLGETIGWEPGVSSGYFGPASSRPVVRGFEGVRVRTLRDDLGTFDLSDVSPDHGVALEPFLLESVEIHRGPASLLYGNSAIGGAVNARSRVLARERPDRAISGGWETRYETQGDGLSGAGHLSLLTGPLVFRFTGSARDSGDLSIPGRARSGAYEKLENPRVYDPASGTTIPVPNPDGTLPNSGHDGSTWSAGVSWLPEKLPLLLGASYSRFDTRYGVPWIYPGDPTDLYGNYTLDLIQDRFDLEGSIDLDHGPVSKIETRLAYGAYRHAELFEGLGKDRGRDFADSTFEKDAIEGRVDVHHRALDERLTGIIGISGGTEDFTAVRTVFPPPDPQRVRSTFRTDQAGLYLLEKYEQGEWAGQLGYRIEKVRIHDHSLEQSGYLRGGNDFSNSASAALTWTREGAGPLDRLALTGIVSRVERLPTATERYAFWNNAGIGRFLVGGDLDGSPLSTEESLGFELGLEADKGPVKARLNGYHYDFDNFIFLQEAPELTGGFGRAVQYIERAATFTGFEAELDWTIREHLTLSLMSDYVRAENKDDNEPIPRMPPLRFGTRLEWSDDRFTAGIEVRHATAQDRVKPAPRPELPTGSYTLVNADVSWTVPVRSHEFTVFLRGTNLLNEEARVSTSFRKDVAPLPGRGVSLGVRHEF